MNEETPEAIPPRLLLDLALDAAREAGAMLREKLGAPLQVEFKGAHNNLVTDADRASEAIITGKIRARYPDHRILAEEGTTGAESSPYRWLIDPVDGTTNFAHAVPAFAVSIGVEREGALQAGVVYNPATDELFAAGRGDGATLNGRPIHVSTVEQPEAALIGTGVMGYIYKRRFVLAGPVFWKVTQGCRTTGAAALDLCYVACGRFDLFCSPSLSAWDLGGGALIVAEAGGRVTDFEGNLHRVDQHDILASNGALHPFGLRVVRGEILSRPGFYAGLRAIGTRLARRRPRERRRR
jgi:myo-inositol-1(or 4)-monophosphatase